MIASVWYEIIEHSAGLGTLLGSLVAGGGLVWAILKWQLSKTEKRITNNITESIDQRYRRYVRPMAERLLDAAALAPLQHVTLDFILPDDTCLKIPIPEHDWAEVLPGLYLTQGGRTPTETTVILRTIGSVSLPWHHHGRVESLTLMRGTATDLSTGRILEAGDKWEIPTHHTHICSFHNALAIIKYRPPLLTADIDPPQIEGIERMADHLEE